MAYENASCTGVRILPIILRNYSTVLPLAEQYFGF